MTANAIYSRIAITTIHSCPAGLERQFIVPTGQPIELNKCPDCPLPEPRIIAVHAQRVRLPCGMGFTTKLYFGPECLLKSDF